MNKYGFYDRLTEEYPSQVLIDLCEVCNYECIHCPQSQFKKSETFSGAYFSEELNKKLVDEVALYGKGYTQQMRYAAAGEPLLHPKAIEILEYAVKNSGTMVTLTTNGSLLNSEKIDKLLDMEIGMIDFSIDALNDDTYAEIRKKGVLSVVRNNILEILRKKSERNKKTRIVVSFVEQEKNTAERDGFRKYWEDNGVDFVVIRQLHSAGGFFYKSDTEKKDVQPCVYPWERIVLDSKGDIEFCPASWLGKTKINHNYADITIKEIWNGDDYKKLREEHLNNKFERFNVCAECPDRELTIWPQNKTETLRGYGDMISDFSKEDAD